MLFSWLQATSMSFYHLQCKIILTLQHFLAMQRNCYFTQLLLKNLFQSKMFPKMAFLVIEV